MKRPHPHTSPGSGKKLATSLERLFKERQGVTCCRCQLESKYPSLHLLSQLTGRGNRNTSQLIKPSSYNAIQESPPIITFLCFYFCNLSTVTDDPDSVAMERWEASPPCARSRKWLWTWWMVLFWEICRGTRPNFLEHQLLYFFVPLPLLHYIELCVYPAGKVRRQGESVRPNTEVTLTKHTTACWIIIISQ